MNDEKKYYLYWASFLLIAIYLWYTQNWIWWTALFMTDWMIRNHWNNLPNAITLSERHKGDKE